MKLISSRRAYEFRMDDLRLTILSLSVVQESVKKLFSFGGVEIGSPTPTFGPVPPTLPPGLVVHTGAWVSDEKQLVPIRMLNFEPRRIVVDVAGPSSAIEPIFGLLRHTLATLNAPDGSPAIGEPERTRDFSEISVSVPLDLTDLLSTRARDILSRAVLAADPHSDLAVVPVVTLQVQPKDSEFQGVAPVGSAALQLAPRAGTHLGEHIYYSAAPLTSDAHQAYLVELLGALGIDQADMRALPEGEPVSVEPAKKVTRTKRSSRL